MQRFKLINNSGFEIMKPDSQGEWIKLQDAIDNAAALMGMKKSEAKANASRNNGKLGGRPKKIK